MNNPVRQHYIPKSYLRNFAENRDNKYFVSIKRKNEDIIKDNISIKDICVEKNLYTLSDITENKFLLENFYADNIDAVYPEIYELLIDDCCTKITSEQRSKIIATVLSLYFRTPKFLNAHNELTKAVLRSLLDYANPTTGIVKADFLGRKLEFHISEINQVQEEVLLENKRAFLHTHLKFFSEFINYKQNDGIVVIKITDEAELITCDNPVIIRGVLGEGFHLFDPSNIIDIPLNSKYYLTIMPKNLRALTDKIHRWENDTLFAVSTNLQIEQNAEDVLIGSHKSLENHISDQINYNKSTPDTIKLLELMKQKAEKLKEIDELMSINNCSITHPIVLSKIKELSQLELFKGDNLIENLILGLAQKGFSI